jgi:hypothetical protein
MIAVLVLAASAAYSQDKSTGGIKGKVRVEVGSPNGITVVIREGERELRHISTDKTESLRLLVSRQAFTGSRSENQLEHRDN